MQSSNPETYIYKKSRRARQIRVTVYPDVRVVVTAPFYVPKFLIERFVREKQEWIERKIREFCNRQSMYSIETGKYGTGTTAEYMANKERARGLAHECVRHFAAVYGVSVGTIRIGNQKSRWGSCSREGNLSFNYRIVFLPQELLEYLIVHEVCHILEFNHSKAFWELVAKTVPEYQELRKKLKGLG